NIGPGEEVKKSERRPRLAEFFDLSSDCGLVLCTKHSRPYCPCQAIRGQTEYFRANAARKYLVSPRIADCAPGLAAGFDSFTVSCPRIAPKDQIPTASLRAATGPCEEFGEAPIFHIFRGPKMSSVAALQTLHRLRL